MLTASLGAQCMLWQTSPAATEMETRVLDWLRQMIGLPEGFAGVIQDTASAATLCALLTARERHTNWRSNESGLAGGEAFTAYCSGEAHSSVEKAVKIAGLGAANLRKIAVDERFAMRADALEEAIRTDLDAGRTPLFAVATLGTTGSSGFDPLQRIGEICAGHGIWLHVDAAWAGSALVLPEQGWMIEGVERADSFVFNPHKWLFTNFDCSAYFVRDASALVRTFEILPEYLRTTEAGRVIDYRDWGIPLGRRFRALKLWFVLRSYGVEGLRAALRAHIEMARALASQIDAATDFELLVPPVLSLLCFRYRPAAAEDRTLDELNRRLLNRLNDSGALYLTQTRINGAFAIRFAIGQTATEPRHVEAAWSQIQETARAAA
jgi:aromatic-L-amino-acid decarboxylase